MAKARCRRLNEQEPACSAARPTPNARTRPAYTEGVQISAKVDYGVRALLVLAISPEPMTVDAIAADQQIPSKFLGVILNDLRRVGILVSHRGREAGYHLGRPSSDITLADVIRALEGPLAQVRGLGARNGQVRRRGRAPSRSLDRAPGQFARGA